MALESRTLVAGAVTVAVVLVVIAIAIPSYQGYLHRSRMREVIQELGRVRALVSDEMVARNPGAAPKRDFKPESPMVARVSVDFAAKTVAAFVDPDRFGHPAMPRNGSVTLTAVMDGARIVDWKCTSDVPAKFLPAGCR